MSVETSLFQLLPGESAVISKLLCQDSIRRRLLDMGFTCGTPITCVGASPHKNPKAFFIRGAVIALRSQDSMLIHILQKESQP